MSVTLNQVSWNERAANARVVLHADVFVGSKVAVDKKSGLPSPVLDFGFVQEVADKMMTGAHFAYFDNPVEAIRRTESQYATMSLEEVAKSVRAFEYVLARDVGHYIAENNPSFLNLSSEKKLVQWSSVFEPKPNMADHVDYFDDKVLSVNAATQNLSPSDRVAEITIRNLEGLSMEEKEDMFLIPLHRGRIRYLNDTHPRFSDLEYMVLEPPEYGDFLIYMIMDNLVTHGAGIQKSEKPRIIASTDIHSKVECRDVLSPDDSTDFYRQFVEGEEHMSHYFK